MSVPRVAAFARLANGPTAPKRAIEGQTTQLSRTMHGIDYDPTHDEFYIPVALGGALLSFRGGASGEEPPVRVLQGDQTGLIRPQTVAVDPVHNELYAGDPSARAVLVFRRDASGNVAPIRVLRGPESKIVEVNGVAVDPVHNLLVVAQYGHTPETTGLLIFNRTDNGDVAPRAVIAGPKTRLRWFRQVVVDPKTGKIFIASEQYRFKAPSAYVGIKPREGFDENNLEERGRLGPEGPFGPDRTGFIGVWDIHDNGDVPPRAILRGPDTMLRGPGGVAIDPEHGEVIAADGTTNGFHVFFLPQFFRPDFWSRER